MALTQKLSTALVQALAATVSLQITPFLSGFFEIRSGTQPATADTPPSDGIVLATISLPGPAFLSPVNGVLVSAGVFYTPQAEGTGIATWFRLYDDVGNALIDGSVGLSGCNLNMNTTSIVAGAEVSIEVTTITCNKE